MADTPSGFVIYDSIFVGEVAGGTSAAVLPTVVSSLVYLRAPNSNVGDVYVGGAGVTIPQGTTDATSGVELSPGDNFGPLPISNLNLLYRICDNAGDDLVYMVVV